MKTSINIDPVSHLLNLQCTCVGHKEKRCHFLLANALKM